MPQRVSIALVFSLFASSAMASDCASAIKNDTKEPFKKLLACVVELELAQKAVVAIPKDTISFFMLEKCPDTWTDEPRLAGRYPVGLTVGGILGSEIGTKLDANEDRAAGAHTHGHNTVVMADRYPPPGANVQFRNPGGGHHGAETVTAGLQSLGSRRVDDFMTHGPYSLR